MKMVQPDALCSSRIRTIALILKRQGSGIIHFPAVLICLYGRNDGVHHEKMAETSQQNEDVKNLVATKRRVVSTWPLDSV